MVYVYNRVGNANFDFLCGYFFVTVLTKDDATSSKKYMKFFLEGLLSVKIEIENCDFSKKMVFRGLKIEKKSIVSNKIMD